ncbi:MAG: Rieske 2Fe-2S domain-containing protein [Leptolyngbya sp. SIO4C1]|nr:Rieske 2Fe-2S domain-containing protein [Leptolyngbya sp. SIO4C1]
MESAPLLQGQPIERRVREVGIIPNYWYPALWSDQLRIGQIVPVTVWKTIAALYRAGQLHGLENACSCKGIELHRGGLRRDEVRGELRRDEVQGHARVCPRHSWAFDDEGCCVSIPYFPPELKTLLSLYLRLQPVGPTSTQSFSMLFLKLPLPRWLRQGFIGSLLEKLVLHQVFLKFLAQDIEMIESEQRSYLANPNRDYVEVNPAINALQRVTIRQYEKFMQQSKRVIDSQARGHRTLSEIGLNPR